MTEEIKKPDLSLLHQYNSADSSTWRPIGVAHYEKGEKNLFYVNAAHVNGIENPTCETIKLAMEQYKPDAIILELRQVPHDLEALKKDEFKAGESCYAAYLALEHKIPIICGEPSDAQMYQEMQKRGYSEQDTAGFLLLRSIPQNRQNNPEFNETDFSNHHANKEHLEIFGKGDKAQNLVAFKDWYTNKTGNTDFIKIDGRELAPNSAPDASYLQKMSLETGVIRENNVIGKISEQLGEHDKVMVVYGGGHLVQSRPVLDQMFGSTSEDVVLVNQKPPQFSPKVCEQVKDLNVAAKLEAEFARNSKYKTVHFSKPIREI